MRAVVAMILATLALAVHPMSATGLEPRAGARALAQSGVKAYEAGRFGMALDFFQRADALDPNPRLQLNLGLCFEKLDRPADAARAFALYLATEASDPHVPLKKLATARSELKALDARVALLSLHVVPAAATVELDGQPAPTGPIYLQRGSKHRLQAHAPGFTDGEQAFEPPPTGAVSVTLVLTVTPPPTAEVSVAPPAQVPPAPSPPPDLQRVPDVHSSSVLTATRPLELRRNRVPAYVAWGLAVALAIPTAVFGVQALSRRSEIDTRQNQCGSRDGADYDSECGAWHQSAERADVFGSLTVAAGITGAVLWYAAPTSGGAQAGVQGTF